MSIIGPSVGGVEFKGSATALLVVELVFFYYPSRFPSVYAVKTGNLLNELRARSAFAETSDLGDIEEQRPQGVGRVGVEGLKAPLEPCVAVAVRPAGTKHKHLASGYLNSKIVEGKN